MLNHIMYNLLLHIWTLHIKPFHFLFVAHLPPNLGNLPGWYLWSVFLKLSFALPSKLNITHLPACYVEICFSTLLSCPFKFLHASKLSMAHWSLLYFSNEVHHQTDSNRHLIQFATKVLTLQDFDIREGLFSFKLVIWHKVLEWVTSGNYKKDYTICLSVYTCLRANTPVCIKTQVFLNNRV